MLNPDEIELTVSANGGGNPFEMGQVTLSSSFADGELTPYGEVLNGIFHDDPLLSIRGDVAERCWEIVEPVVNAGRPTRSRSRSTARVRARPGGLGVVVLTDVTCDGREARCRLAPRLRRWCVRSDHRAPTCEAGSRPEAHARKLPVRGTASCARNGHRRAELRTRERPPTRGVPARSPSPVQERVPPSWTGSGYGARR